jgi:hypothetical protein
VLLGKTIDCEEPVHEWFGLTYASYQVVPRSVLQSTPINWQKKFIKLMDELDEMGYVCPLEGTYDVRVRDSKGRYVEDYYRDYERGRRFVEPRRVKIAKGIYGRNADAEYLFQSYRNGYGEIDCIDKDKQSLLFEDELNKTRRMG